MQQLSVLCFTGAKTSSLYTRQLGENFEGSYIQFINKEEKRQFSLHQFLKNPASMRVTLLQAYVESPLTEVAQQCSTSESTCERDLKEKSRSLENFEDITLTASTLH